MKMKKKSIAFAVLALIFLTVLPVALQMYIPREFFTAFSIMGGIDLAALLNKVAVIGVVLSIFIILRGAVEKYSETGLALSIAYKVFWLVIVLFALGLGKIENLGVAVLSGSGGGASNVVMFDLRLIALLATAVVALMIAHSVIEQRERKA